MARRRDRPETGFLFRRGGRQNSPGKVKSSKSSRWHYSQRKGLRGASKAAHQEAYTVASLAGGKYPAAVGDTVGASLKQTRSAREGTCKASPLQRSSQCLNVSRIGLRDSIGVCRVHDQPLGSMSSREILADLLNTEAEDVICGLDTIN